MIKKIPPPTKRKMEYEEVTIKICKDDVLKSKLGFIFQSSMMRRWYKTKEVKYLGNGNWKMIGDREDIDVTKK